MSEEREQYLEAVIAAYQSLLNQALALLRDASRKRGEAVSFFDIDYCRNGCGTLVGHQDDYCDKYPQCRRGAEPAPAKLTDSENTKTPELGEASR